MRPDELDLPSGTIGPAKDADGNRIERELSFRELGAYFARENRSWDDLTPRVRLVVEQSRDAMYKPLQPGEGYRARRKQRRD